MTGLIRKCLLLTIAIFGAIIFIYNEPVYAIPDGNATGSDYNPRQVQTSVRNMWVNNKSGIDMTRGGKYPSSVYTAERGNWLAYDVYTGASNNSLKRGLRLATLNGERVLRFNGWAANIGYMHHTRDNQATYIGLINKKDRTDKKIYKARMTALHPHTNRDIYYVNTSGPEWCPDSARRQSLSYCNMRYQWNGFEANIPLSDLFDENEPGEWELYIIKNVNGNVLYDRLILGSSFNDLDWAHGKLSFTSGLNTNTVIMVTSNVARRVNPGPRTPEDSGKYFDANRRYTTTRISEDLGVPVWYGVRSPHDNNQTRYAGSMYWQFGGDIATLKYEPETTPPEHRQHGISNHRYQKDNTYWVRPNDSVNIRLRGYDRDSLIQRTNLRLLYSSADVDVRSRYYYANRNLVNYRTSPHVTVNSASRTYQSSTQRTREATFNVTPKTHNHNYSIYAWHSDNAGNNTGWVNTGLRLRVDGQIPGSNTYQQEEVIGARYENGNDHWIRPEDKVDIRLRGYDQHSKLNRTSVRLSGSGATGAARFLYERYQPSDIPAGFDYHNPSIYFDILSGRKTYESSTSNTREATFTVQPKSNTHGHNYVISHWQHDNVGNNTGWVDTGMRLRIDGQIPGSSTYQEEEIIGARYVNGNEHWIRPEDQVEIRLRGYDKDSKLNRTSLRLSGSGATGAARFVYERYQPSDIAAGFDYHNPSIYFDILSGRKTYESSTSNTREATFTVRPKSNTHGHKYVVSHWQHDNVGNNTGWVDTGLRLGMDAEAPTVAFRNIEDTSDFTGRDWSQEPIEVRLKITDPHSGVKQSRYAWKQVKELPSESEWSDWSTNTNYVVSKTEAGIWYLYVETEDNVGNKRIEAAGVYKLNHPPKADFTYEGYPNHLFEGDPLKLINTSTDKDGHDMTAKWTITDPDGVTKSFTGKLIDPHGSSKVEGNWHVTIYDLTDPSNPIPKPGDYIVHLEVTDIYNHKDEITKTINIKPLQISGKVSHTAKWKEIHDLLGNDEHIFFSGERFMLSSTVTDNSVGGTQKEVEVEVTFQGKNIHDEDVEVKTILSESSRNSGIISHNGEIYEEFMSDPYNKLRSNTNMYFDFKATWSNGVIKNDIVGIRIVSDVYDFYKLHRTN